MEAGRVVPDDAVAKAHTEATEDEGTADFADHVHNYLWNNVALADQKATFLFAGLAAALAFLDQKGVARSWLSDPRGWQLDSWLAFCAVAGCLVGATLAVAVVLPRLAGAQRGIIFWRSIARFKDGVGYARHVRALRRGDLEEAVLRHAFELASIAKRKFRVFNLALWSGAVGLMSALLYLTFY